MGAMGMMTATARADEPAPPTAADEPAPAPTPPSTAVEAPPTAPADHAALTDHAAPADHAPDAAVSGAEQRISIGLATNIPAFWSNSFGASVYVGLQQHHAIRANFARYDNRGPILMETLAGIAGGEDFPSHHGQITDEGIAWVYYPNRLWNGLTLEIGALRRERHITTVQDESTPQRISRDSTTYSGRALIGGSVSFWKVVVLSAAVGLSVGREGGLEHSESDPDRHMPPVDTKLGRVDVTGEGYIRMGFKFDL
jgi:hypothetical protein